jgi:hypothetical protein
MSTKELEKAGIHITRSQRHKNRLVIIVDADTLVGMLPVVRSLLADMERGITGSFGGGAKDSHYMNFADALDDTINDVTRCFTCNSTGYVPTNIKGVRRLCASCHLLLENNRLETKIWRVKING